ncbi:sigma-70 family RNA polymerase sigma factor [Chitinophaga pollutisoli]|uniref:Sigma-70 family RNA polymerase sigma factor n=1 Tax=Chitinophaga pollutisoli TaxID=3133966 RepID=A0ABZ2YSW0_9BACT
MIRTDAALLFQQLPHPNGEAALMQLHSLFFNRIFKLILSLVKQREPAEELASDVFMELWQRREKLSDIRNYEVYLYVIARNKAFTYLRQQLQLTDPLDQIEDFRLELARSPEDLLISSEMLHRIHMAINELPPKCKLIFQLVKEQSFKYREVAEILNISPKTVEAQMGIAIKKLGKAVAFSTT